MNYVNAYAVERCYGGPEEGGWYYDEGTPIASVPVETEAEEIAAEDRLRNTLEPLYKQPHGRTRSSVLGGADLVITVEEHFAAAYPTERPHYE